MLLALSLLLAGYMLGRRTGPVEAKPCAVEAPADTRGTITVLVYFACDRAYRAIPRQVARVSTTEALLAAALLELLKGPSAAERSLGFSSDFSENTAGMLNSVTMAGEGRAIVDFRDFSPYMKSAGTTAGTFAMNAQLFRTIFQFEEVREVLFQFNGDCEAFYGWTQAVECLPTTREDWDQRAFDWL